MTLTKSEIISRVYKEMGVSKKESSELVEVVFKVIKETLAKGEKVKISGFGNFSIRDKSTRLGRNPQTGDSMEISARRVLTFRPSHVLRDDITSKYLHRIDSSGNEDTSIPPKEGHSRALGPFTGGDDIDDLMDEDDSTELYNDDHDETPNKNSNRMVK